MEKLIKEEHWIAKAIRETHGGYTCLPIDGRIPTYIEKRNEERRKIKLGVDIIDAINAIYYLSQRPDSFNMIMKERKQKQYRR